MTSEMMQRRADYYARLAPYHLSPLWESLHRLVPLSPNTTARGVLWSYRQIRPQLIEAGDLISATEAVRRVLVMENPELPGQLSITPSLYAGLQLLLPGEIAPSHRHTQTAIRLVLEGEGAYTAVDGERIAMRPGDFIITPAWTWHDHGHPGQAESGAPVVWLDGLDIPMMRFFGAGFAENYPEPVQPVRQAAGVSQARYGQGLLPVRHRAESAVSPIFSYPYARSRDALEILKQQGELDAWEGVKLRYANPATGGWATPTIGTSLQLLPAGFVGRAWRGTDATVFTVIEGQGEARIGTERFAFEPNDVFVVPSWTALRLAAQSECVLFSFSDRPVQQALGILREEFITD